MADRLIYKKYANRRLYDTEKSAYVTLAEVARKIRRGRQVQVLDAKSREDVTAFILTQIILEEAKNRNALLPSPLLHLIIEFGDNTLAEFFETYLQQIIQTYLAQKSAFETHFKQWIDMGMGMPAGIQQNMADFNPLASIFGFGAAPEGEGTQKKPSGSDDESKR